MIESALPLLRSFVPRVLSRVSRLRAERQAAVLPVIQSTDLVTQALDETLKRLRGGSIEDTWWHNILNRLGQKYISPDFLRTPALQTWLAGEQVAIDFKTLATTRLVSADEDDAETRTPYGAKKRPRAQVFSEDPILLPEIVDQIVLVTVHPASEREDEELQRRRHSLRLLGRLDQHRPSLGRFFAP